MSEPRYRCNDCGKEFDEPATEYNHEYFWGAPCTLEYSVCPLCGSDAVEEIEEDEDEEGGENDETD